MARFALRDHKGFTLIELLAVMAIVAVLAGIVSVSVAGAGQTSKDVRVQQDATTVGSSVAEYFNDQQGAETRSPRVVEVFEQREIKQVISSVWPENFITVAYPEVFPEGIQSKVGSIFFLDKDGNLSDLRVRGLLQRFNAVDFDLLSEDGFLTAVPEGTSGTSRGFDNYFWLLEKSTDSSSNGDASARKVAVFKLDSVQTFTESDLVDLIYRRLFGGEFVDAIPVASPQFVDTDEDTPKFITLDGTDLDTCELTFIIEQGPTDGLLSAITNQLCVLAVPNTDSASLTYTPNLNFNGEDSFTYRVIDGNGDDLGKVTVTINVINDDPFVTQTTLDDIEVDEDGDAISVDVSGAFDDVDIATNEDSLAYEVILDPDQSLISASLVGSSLDLQFLPNANGITNVIVRVTDELEASVDDTFDVKINAVNDPPTFIVGPPVTVPENSSPQSLEKWAPDIKAGPPDEFGQLLTFVVKENSNSALFSSQPVVLPDGTLKFTPLAGANGEAAITLVLTDGGGTGRGGTDTSLPQSFLITMNPFIRNGSFENDPVDANHWVVVSGNIDWLPSSVWVPSDGVYSLDLNGSVAGAISQTFDTVAGTLYEVLFDMAGNTHSIRTYTMRVSAASQSEVYTFDNFGKTTTNMGWKEKSFLFTASASTTILTFESLTDNGDRRDGPALDNVRVRFPPESCQDILALNSGATDGDYTISPNGQTFTVYCHDMAGTPSEYLTLINTGGDFNYGQYTVGGASNGGALTPENPDGTVIPNIGTDVRTNYSKIRLDPATLIVDTGDQTFSSSTGFLYHSNGTKPAPRPAVTSMPYATAVGCKSGSANGTANIDLRGTPFAVADTFTVLGFQALGGSTFSTNDQVVNVTGGGFCGNNGPTNTVFLPVNDRGSFSLDLAYVGS